MAIALGGKEGIELVLGKRPVGDKRPLGGGGEITY